VPLAGAGGLTAHSVADKLAEPHSHERAELLSATGHGYLELEPLFIACGLMLIVAGRGCGRLRRDAADARKGRQGGVSDEVRETLAWIEVR
jgi:hypothetical protein